MQRKVTSQPGWKVTPSSDWLVNSKLVSVKTQTSSVDGFEVVNLTLTKLDLDRRSTVVGRIVAAKWFFNADIKKLVRAETGVTYKDWVLIGTFGLAEVYA